MSTTTGPLSNSVYYTGNDNRTGYSISLASIPPPMFTFSANGATGKLFEKDGKLHFEGDFAESAKIFIEHCVNYGQYLKQKIQQELKS